VFDLDETLVHCVENNFKDCSMTIDITLPSGESVKAGINIRPYTLEILELLNKLCEVVLFTASHSCYASKVI
jgi:CTD small phosphatase-like protein 2